MDGFHNDFVGGTDRYPHTLMAAAAILYHSIVKTMAVVDPGVSFVQDLRGKDDTKKNDEGKSDKFTDKKKGPGCWGCGDPAALLFD